MRESSALVLLGDGESFVPLRVGREGTREERAHCGLWVGLLKLWKERPVETTDAANSGDVVTDLLKYSVQVALLACAGFFVRPRCMRVRRSKMKVWFFVFEV